jgi:hypothetical protein
LYSRSTAASGAGVVGESNNGAGVEGNSNSGYGVRASSASGFAVYGYSATGRGVVGASVSGPGVYGQSSTGYAGEFNGDVQVNGELTREYAPGTSNNVGPIAYAFIEGDEGSAVVRSGTPNLSAIYNATYEWYEITIADEHYFFADYVTIVTPSTSDPVFATTGSLADKLIVYCHDLEGSQIPCNFQVVVYKP